MPLPKITYWSGNLFKRQLTAALDWLAANAGGGGGGGPVAWDDITGKPSLFAPDLATHLADSNPHAVYLTQAEADTIYAGSVSPSFSGTPSAPTAAPGANTTQIATTAFVQAVVAALINAAPGALDTLEELAAALGDDANFAATMTAALAGKLNLAGGTMTGLLSLYNGTDAALQFPILSGDPASPMDGQVWRRASDVRWRIGSTNYSAMHTNGAQPVTGKKSFQGSTSATALFALVPGVAPTAPVDGDIWTEAVSMFAQLGSTKEFSFVGHPHDPADVTGLAEFVMDTVAAFLVQGSNVTLTLNDGADALTIDAAGGSGSASPLIGWFI